MGEHPMYTRRRALKLAGSGIALATITGASAASSRTETGIRPGTSDLLYAETGFSRTIIDAEIKRTSPYWELFVIDAETVRERIDDAAVSRAKQDELREHVTTLEREFPTERVEVENEGANDTLIRFERGVDVEDVPEAKLEQVARGVIDGARNRDDVSSRWHPHTHREMGAIAGSQMGLSSWATDIVSDSADDPDFWDPDIPSWVPGFMADYIEQVVHSYSHMYNPERSTASGTAPEHAESYLDDALDSYNNGNTSTAYEELGWGSHFVIDVGNPLHTGAELRQIADPDLHFDHEGWITDNWDSGHDFESAIEDETTHYILDDVEANTIWLAGESHEYVDTVWDILDNDSNWQNNSQLVDITQERLTESHKMKKGGIRYVIDY